MSNHLMATWRASLEAICSRHRLPADSLSLFTKGTAVVAAAGEAAVIKIYRPEDALDRAREARACELLGGALAVPTPEVLATGELEAAPYLVMRRLPGKPLDEAWPEIGGRDRIRLLEELGAATRQLHSIALHDPGALALDWPTFLESQVASAADRQRQRGLEESWVAGIDDFLARSRLLATPPAPSVLVHTELMRDHLMVEPGPGGWRLCGLIDFADSLAGHPRYELPSVGLFVSCGDPALLRRFLLGYGFAAPELTPDLTQELLAWALCHRYANLPWYLGRMPPEPGADQLETLAERWFGLAA